MTTAAARWKPRRDAKLVHENAEVRIYDDGTWEPVNGVLGGHGVPVHGWSVPRDATVYASGEGTTRITTTWNRSKLSKFGAPSGLFYDVQGIVTGTVKAPA